MPWWRNIQFADLYLTWRIYTSRFLRITLNFGFINFYFHLRQEPTQRFKRSFSLKISFRAYNLMTKSITRSLNIVGIWIEKSIYKIVLIYSKLIFRSTISRDLGILQTGYLAICGKIDTFHKNIHGKLYQLF